MKRSLAILSFLLSSVFVSCAFSATLISGNIDAVVFNVSNNPYIVEKDIIIPKGKTVEIPEGVVILFSPFTGFQISGRLVVQGSADRLVVFSSINDNTYNPESEQLPNPFDWNGIFISKDADGAYLNHFVLKYSVYGVKSQCNNIIIQNAVFQHNGQFHFTVNEQIQMVQDNIPFSYGDADDKETNGTAKPGKTPNGKDVSAKPAKKPVSSMSAKHKKVVIFRFTSLGVGLAGGAVAGVCLMKMNQNDDRMAVIRGLVAQNKGTPELDHEYKSLLQVKNNTKIGTIISAVVGGLGVVGFGISFAF